MLNLSLQNMNTVDVAFPAWPLFLWTNPQYGKFLIEPLLQYQVIHIAACLRIITHAVASQASGLYPNKWALHDMGAHYPRAIAHNDGGDEAMPVEGDLLMAPNGVVHLLICSQRAAICSS